MNAVNAARQGASFLDWKVPGWHNRIDLETLNINNCFTCVLGQLFGGYITGKKRLGIKSVRESERLGFIGLYSFFSKCLVNAWVAEIEARRFAELDRMLLKVDVLPFHPTDDLYLVG